MDPLEIPVARKGDRATRWRVAVDRFELKVQFTKRESAACESCRASGTVVVTLPATRGTGHVYLVPRRFETGGGAFGLPAETTTSEDVFDIDGSRCQSTEPSGHGEEEVRMQVRRTGLRIAFTKVRQGYFTRKCFGPYDEELAVAGAFPEVTVSPRMLRRKRFTVRLHSSRPVALEHYDAILTQDVAIRFIRGRRISTKDLLSRD